MAHVKNGAGDYLQLAHDSNLKRYFNLLQQIAPQQLPTPNHRLAFWIKVYMESHHSHTDTTAGGSSSAGSIDGLLTVAHQIVILGCNAQKIPETDW